MNMYVFLAFGLYFSLVGTIGYLAYCRSKKSADFILGSRSLSFWVTALAAHAGEMSGWLFMGFPATVYTTGLMGAWTAIGLTFFMFLAWKFVAPKIRVMTEQTGSLTLPTFFEKHFNDKSGLLRTCAAILCLTFFTFYIAANFVALGYLFQSVFGIDYSTGLAIGSLVVFYTLLGGFLSIAWIDCFQGMFLLGMIVLVPTVALFHVGGWQQVMQAAHAKNVSLSLISEFSLSKILAIINVAAGWGLGYFGMPHIVTKFMGIRDVKETNKAMRVGISWQIIILTAAVCVGLIGLAFFPNGLQNTEQIFVLMTQQLFHPFVASIILCAVLASLINVMGAQVLACSSVLAEDIFKGLIASKNAQITQKRVLWASRFSVLGICALSFLYAYFNRAKIFSLVEYAWCGLGSSFGPLVMVALHSKLRNRWAALAGMLAGGVTAGLWPYTGIAAVAMIPGYFAAFAAMGLVAVCMGKSK